MRKLFTVLFLIATCTLFAAESSTLLNVTATVAPVFTITMTEPSTFNIIGSNDRLIESKQIGSPVIKSNYSLWNVSIDSEYKSTSTVGRLKLDDAETYIPYTFALKDGGTVVLSAFNTPSAAQPITPLAGKSFDLYFYFNSEDPTRWPVGLYRDTLVLSISTD